jgi:hypothetical protein
MFEAICAQNQNQPNAYHSLQLGIPKMYCTKYLQLQVYSIQHIHYIKLKVTECPKQISWYKKLMIRMSWTNFTNKDCLHHNYWIWDHVNSVTQEWICLVDYFRNVTGTFPFIQKNALLETFSLMRSKWNTTKLFSNKTTSFHSSGLSFCKCKVP